MHINIQQEWEAIYDTNIYIYDVFYTGCTRRHTSQEKERENICRYIIYVYIIYVFPIVFIQHLNFLTAFCDTTHVARKLTGVDIYNIPIMNRYEYSILFLCMLWSSHWLALYERFWENLIQSNCFYLVSSKSKNSFVFHWPLEDLSENFDKQFSR